MGKNLEKETGKTEIHVVIPEKDDKGFFINLSELGYNNIRLSEENCRGLITGYYRPKKENK